MSVTGQAIDARLFDSYAHTEAGLQFKRGDAAGKLGLDPSRQGSSFET